MTVHDTMSSIIGLCLELESQALQLYRDFAGRSEDQKRRRLWQELARDEAEHLDYWRRLQEMLQEGAVPRVFDDPEATEERLVQLRSRIGSLAVRARESDDPETRLLLALWMEIYLLDPQFQNLFHCLYNLPDGQNPETDYEQHLGRLMDALQEFKDASPAFELVEEAFRRLWKFNREMIHFATRDHLTGLYNRHGLFAALNPLVYLARRHGQPVGLLMIDLDDFKAVNDRHGHQTGDRVLAEVARRMRARLRQSDIIGRYGGEEFLVVMTPVDPARLAEVAEALREAVAGSSVDGLEVSVSIGFSCQVLETDVEEGMERLLRQADQALFEAKRRGKNRVVEWQQRASADSRSEKRGF